jgi:fluoroacetyl-CoA thioesterase
MKDSLLPGLEHTFKFQVPESKIVPALYPESDEFQMMPHVLATGYMVGLIEWTCIQAINPHLNWPEEQTVGTHINVNHIAPTPPGLTVQVTVQLKQVEGKKLVFNIEARDDVELISQGTHERFIIYPEKFNKKVAQKARPALNS